MTREDLFRNIQSKKSFLCVGLDTDLNKIPKFLLDTDDPIFEFNKAIIDATNDLCVAYKPNIAFYESQSKGWESLEKTVDYMPENLFVIADAKRGDIGNSSKYYAKSFFETLNFDAVTLSPYMGEDSIEPFLTYEGKWAVLLAVTSNPGASDFQLSQMVDDETHKNHRLYELVLKKSSRWGNSDNTMYVVGATRPEQLRRVRKIIPDHFLLVPGVGAQGGSLKEIAEIGMNDHCGLLVNSSRGIIYASNAADFAERAREEAMSIKKEMEALLLTFL